MSASIRVLGPLSHSSFSAALDGQKILLSADGLHRDWRGLAEYARLDVPSIGASSRISFTSHCLHLWGQAGGTLHNLTSALVAMDRHDVIHDTMHLIANDVERINREGFPALHPSLQQQESIHSFVDDNILTVHDQESLERGGGLMHYDALVLHADEDLPFVHTLLEKLEGEYGLRLCVKDRDLIGGLQFESSSVVRLITERCSRVVVIFSNKFLASPQNQYFLHFAHALSLDQRKRILIPCMLEPCERPAVIRFCHSLDYFRAHGYWDYWKKLRDSIVHKPARSIDAPMARITELPADDFPSRLHSSVPQPHVLALPPSADNQAASLEINGQPRTSDKNPATHDKPQKNAVRMLHQGLLKWRRRDRKPSSEDEVPYTTVSSPVTSKSAMEDLLDESLKHPNGLCKNNNGPIASSSTITDVSFISIDSHEESNEVEKFSTKHTHDDKGGDNIIVFDSPLNSATQTCLSNSARNLPDMSVSATNSSSNHPNVSTNSAHTSSSLQRLLPDVPSNYVPSQEISPVSTDIRKKKSKGNLVSKIFRNAKKRVKVSS
ncbi:uncharacterized protein LOC108666044 [Hyalella azteca]|uniref:Uncharacterized protein LOC108666044 n=1 Tax=Hyalella azteca TaxID=294128 RepID=A0A8B7N4Z0_HYAAZ|nr:uncharacterized protein LOC108666044 [Hyalella azteca]